MNNAILYLVRVERWSDTPRPLSNEGPHSDVPHKRHAYHALLVVRALLHHSSARTTLSKKHARSCQTTVGRGYVGGERGQRVGSLFGA